MADRWIISSYVFAEHGSRALAEAEAIRLTDKYPGKKFRVFRIKTSLDRSNAMDVIQKIGIENAKLRERLSMFEANSLARLEAEDVG